MIFLDQLYVPNCSLGADGLYPHPYDNTKYIKCVDGYATVENCISGMIFSKARKYCDYERKVYEYDSGKSYNTLNENHWVPGSTNIIREGKSKFVSIFKVLSKYSQETFY